MPYSVFTDILNELNEVTFIQVFTDYKEITYGYFYSNINNSL